MTKFADQLFDDLMREHGPALERAGFPSIPNRHIAARRALLAAGGTVAVAGAVALVAGSGTPATRAVGTGPVEAYTGSRAYAITKNPGGTITLTVYRKSGIAAANARLSQLGDSQVVVVPVEPGCPSLPPAAVSALGHKITTGIDASRSGNGSVTVNAQGIPAGDILVIGVVASGDGTATVGALTSPPAPTCISPPAAPPGNGGSGS
jgi:hypothetical protein